MTGIHVNQTGSSGIHLSDVRFEGVHIGVFRSNNILPPAGFGSEV